MNLYDLSKYDTIVMWGAGEDALWYNNQFKIDYFVDKSTEKIGRRLCGTEIKEISSLINDEKIGKKILVIISSSKYKNEIQSDIEELGINVDVTDLSVIRALYSHENLSFALWGFDILIRDILIRGGYDICNMSYMEVGACHPILGSNSYNFYLSGARGILVEPNPDLQRELIKYRTDEVVMEGVASEKGTLLYHKFDNEFRNTFDEKEAEDALNKGFKSKGIIELPVETLDNIIDKYNVNTENTFLSIQVMGLEDDILKSFDYKKYKFPLIALAVYSDDIFKYDIFQDYHIIAQVPRHVVLVNDSIYNRILC